MRKTRVVVAPVPFSRQISPISPTIEADGIERAVAVGHCGAWVGVFSVSLTPSGAHMTRVRVVRVEDDVAVAGGGDGRGSGDGWPAPWVRPAVWPGGAHLQPANHGSSPATGESF